MKRTVILVVVLLALLLLSSTSVAESPEKLWWTDFTSDVFTWSDEGLYDYAIGDLSLTVEVAEDAPVYPGTVLLRHNGVRARTDEPGLDCADVDPRIRPGQPVRLQIGWITSEAMSHQDAESYFDSLTVSFTVSWDEEPVSLERHETHAYREGIDFYKVFCRWTVRP